MRIIFMGTPELSRVVLQALLKAGHEIILAVTQPDRERGRGKQLQISPVKALAMEEEIPLFQPERLRRRENIEWLRSFLEQEPADIGVVAAFGQILPKEVLELPRLGFINVHTSLLPLYRGAAPIQQAIREGQDQTGVTIMQMDEGLDTGDIWRQASLAIAPEDTGGSLTEKLARLGAEVLVQTLKDLEAGGLKPIPQQGESSYAPQIKKEEGLIDWSMPVLQIERQIRAFYPWPGCYTYCRGKRMIICKARVASCEKPEGAGPGCIVKAGSDCLEVAASDGVLRIERLKPEGKKEMEAAAYLRGCTLSSGEWMGESDE